MGWFGIHMDKPLKEWVYDINNDKYEVLDYTLVNLKVIYCAVREKSTNKVHCQTYLVHWTPKDYNNFTYKPISEFCGPYTYECPKKIFDLLTPLTDEDDPNGWARNWRENVTKYHEKKKELNKNCLIYIKDGVSFGSGYEYNYFKKLKFADGHRGQNYYKKTKNLYVPYYRREGDANFYMFDTVVRFDPSQYNFEIVDEKVGSLV